MRPTETELNPAMANQMPVVSVAQTPAQSAPSDILQPVGPAQTTAESFSSTPPTLVATSAPAPPPVPSVAPPIVQPLAPAPQPTHRVHPHWIRWIIGAAILLGLGVFIAAFLFMRNSPATSRTAAANETFEVQDLDLSDFMNTGDLNLLTNQSLSINGQLRANGGLVLAPSSRPENAVLGQMYYDNTSDTPYFFNGTEFVGMGVNGLSAGSGISINGSTITNNGVVSLRAVSPQLSFTQGANGEYILNTAGNFLTSTGTAGKIAFFDSANNLAASQISQVGTTTVVDGNLQVGGSVQTNNISLLTPGQELNITAGNNQVVFTSEGRHFQLPSTGGVNQTICTVGMDCASGGSTVYLQLQPGAAQNDIGSGPSIFLNNTGGGSLLRLQGSGIDRFVVGNNGNTAITGNLAVSGTVNGATISGGNISGGTVNGAYISGGTMTGGSLTDTEVNGLGLTSTAITSTGALSLTAANNQNLNLNTSGTGIVSLGTSMLQGSGALTISAGGVDQDLTLTGSGLGNVVVQNPLFYNANGAAYEFDAADLSGTATICTSAGNCIGSGAGVGGSGTPGTIAVWDGTGFTLTDSIVNQSGSALTVSGTVAATSFSGSGASLTGVNAAQLNGQAASYYLNATNIGTGTLADARLSSNVTLLGNTFNGSNQLVQLNASGQLPALNGSLLTSVNAAQLNGQVASYYLNASNISTGTLNDSRLSANVALLNAAANFTGTLQQGGDDVCTTAGNCAGTGAGVGGSGTAGVIAVWNGTGFTLGDSLLSQSGGTVTVTGDFAATSLQGDGSAITNLDASNVSSGTLTDARLSANVALLNTAANFTGALQQSGNDVCTTAGNCVGTGSGGAVGGSGTAGVIAVWDGSGFTLTDSLLSQSGGTVTVAGDFAATNLQGNGSAVTNVDADLLDGLDSTDFAAASGSNSYIWNGTSTQTANIAVQSAAAANVGVLIQGATSQTADLLQLQNSAGGVLAKVDASGVVTGGGFILTADGGASSLPAFQGAGGQRIFSYGNGWGVGNTGGSVDIRTSDGTSSVNLGSGSDVQIKRGSTTLWVNPGTSGGQYVRYDNGGGGQLGYIDNNLGQYYALQSAGTIGIQLKAAASQTADFLQVQDSTGAVLSTINASGNLGLGTATPGSYRLNVQGGDANFGANVATGGTTRLNSSGALQNITDYSQTSGNFSQSGTGTFTTGTGAVTLAGAATANGTLTVAGAGTFQNTLSVTGSGFINAGSTLNTALALGDFATGGSIGSAASTVDTHTSIAITQTTVGQTLSLSSPTVTTAGRVVYILNTGSTPFTMTGITVPAGYGQMFIWNGTSWTLGASGGGAAVTLQGSYDGGSTINTTDARDIMFGLSDTTTDSNFVLNIATSSTSKFKIQNNGTDVVTVGSAGQLTLAVQGSGGGVAVGGDTLLYRSATNRLQMNNALTLKNTTDTSTAFQIQNSLGVDVLTVDTSNKKIYAGGDIRFEQPLATRSKIVFKDTTNNLEFGTGYQQDPGYFWLGLQNNSDSSYLAGMTKNTSYYSAGLRTAVSGTRAGLDFVVGDDVASNLDSFTPMSLLTTGGTTSLNLQAHSGGDALLSFQGLNTTTNAMTDRGLIRYQQNQVLFDNYTGGTLFVRTGTTPGDVVNRLLVGNNGAGNIALAVRGVSGQTADLQQWQDSTGTALAKITSTGTIQGLRLATAASLYDHHDAANNMAGYFNTTSSTTYSDSGLNVMAQAGSLTGQYYGGLVGISGQANYVSNGSTEILTLQGGSFSATRQGPSANVVRDMIGARLIVNTSSVGTTNNTYGAKIEVQGDSTNAYGLFVQALTGTHTTQYGIYQEGANDINYLNGSLGIGTNTPGAYRLNVQSGNVNLGGNLAVGGDITLAASKSLTVTGGNTGSRPASPTEGMVYYDQTTKQLLTYANGKWQSDRSTATKIIAPSNATQTAKDSADVVLTGTADQTLINTALTAAAGGKVYLMEGTVSITAAISIPNNTTLAGSGAGTLITIPNGQNGTYSAITNTTAGGSGTGVTIQDLRLDGNKANQTSGSMIGISLSGMGSGTGSSAIQGAKLSNVWVNNWYGAGYPGAGISVVSSSNNTITNTTTQGNANSGIYLESSSNNTITTNTAQGNGNAGINLSSGASNNTVTGNTTQGNSSGILLDGGASNNTTTGNTTQGNTIGIYLSGSSNNTVTGNTVRGNTSYGIDLFNISNNNTVSGNKFYDNGGATTNNGIYLSASDSNTITGNSITDTSASTNNYAINISNSTSDTNYVSGNTLGSATINDLGTGTNFASQINSSNVLISRTSGGTSVQSTAGANLFSVNAVTNALTAGQASTTDTFTKLTDPASLLGSAGLTTAYSPDGQYMSVVNSLSTYITIYKRSGDTFTKLADPATLPTGAGRGTAFSPDGQYMSVAHDTSPYITIYKRSGDTFTKLTDPATLPAGNGNATAFSPDGQYMSVAHYTSPYITIYKRSGDTFTKLSNPATLPTGASLATAFSPDGQYMSVAQSASPYIAIYKRSGDTFTKLTDPATLPASTGRGTAFSPDGQYMSVSHTSSPYITIYKRSGDTFTKLTDPATLPTGTGNATAFSPDGQYMSVSHDISPYITIYKRSGDTFTKLTDPATLPAGTGRGTAFSPDGQYLSVSHSTSPYVTTYKIGDGQMANVTVNGLLNGSSASFSALSVSGATTLQNSLLVQGSAVLNDSLSVGGTLSVVGAATFSGTLNVTGATTVANITVNGHIIGGGSTPTIAAGTAACTTPTVSVSGTDTSGIITVTTGTGCAASGKLATITFASAFGAAPRVTLTSAGTNAAGLVTYIDSATISTTAFDLGTTTTAANSTTYKWYYQVIQ